MPDPIPHAKQEGGETASLKIPPHSIEAEQAVLGGILINNDVWEKVSEKLLPDDFYRNDHRTIFRAVAALDEAGSPYDVVTVAEWLESRQQLDEASGPSYLAMLSERTPGISNINAYADIVKKRSILRQLIAAAQTIGESVFNPKGLTNEEILNLAEKVVFEIAEREARGRRSYISIRDLLDISVDRVDKLSQSKSHITGIATSFGDLDMKTSGLQKADLIIIAGRPSMGKTALAINIAEHAAIREELSVAVFSMEMSSESLAMRMMSSLGRIDQHVMRTGRLQGGDWDRLSSAVSMLEDKRLYIDDTPALAPAEIRSRCRRLKRDKKGLDLVIVDYLQLMQVPGSNENRATEISEISRSLKAMAKELDIPVIALSQLNRSLEQRTNKRPIMSDLRESGALEQDADLIIFIYRDEVYNENSEEKGKAEIIIAKQRNGPIGKIFLTFLGQFTRFEGYAEEYTEEHHD